VECGGSSRWMCVESMALARRGESKSPAGERQGGIPMGHGAYLALLHRRLQAGVYGRGQRAQETASAVREQGEPSGDVEEGSRHDFSPTGVRRRSERRGIAWRPTGCTVVSAASPLRRTSIAAVVDTTPYRIQFPGEKWYGWCANRWMLDPGDNASYRSCQPPACRHRAPGASREPTRGGERKG
jgi:hypothetical protein